MLLVCIAFLSFEREVYAQVSWSNQTYLAWGGYVLPTKLFSSYPSVVFGAEHRFNYHHSLRFEVGTPFRWYVPSTPLSGLFNSRENLNFIHLAVEGRHYKDKNFFWGARIEHIPAWYSRTNEVAVYRNKKYSYRSASIRDFTTKYQALAGLRANTAGRMIPIDFFVSAGLRHHFLRHVKFDGLNYEGIPISEEDKLKGRKEGHTFSFAFSIGISAGIFWQVTRDYKY